MKRRRTAIKYRKQFSVKLARSISAELEKSTSYRRKLFASLAKEGAGLLLVCLFSLLIIITWYQFVAKFYLNSSQTFGSIIFKDLSLMKFITDYLPFPVSGWIPTWNLGSPLIGSYPTTWYYLVLPLALLWGVTSGVQIAAMLNLLLYFIFCLLVFTRINKNPLLSWVFTLLLLVNPGTYYTTVVKGDLVSAAVMPFLPLAFLLLYDLKNHQRLRIITFSLLIAFSLLLHPLSALISVFMPILLSVIFSKQIGKTSFQERKSNHLEKPISKLKFSLTLLIICITVSLPSLYALFQNSGKLTTTSPCNHALCWGNYPSDFQWFTSILLVPPVLFLIIFLLSKVQGKNSNKAYLQSWSYLAGLISLLFYIFLVHSKFLNTIASEVPPLEMYWSVSFFILIFSSDLYIQIQRVGHKNATLAISIFFIITLIATPIFSQALSFRLDRVTPGSATLPAEIERYVLEKYQDEDHPINKIVPKWIKDDTFNWRIDSNRPDFYTWWNVYSPINQTRGYVFLPSKEQQNWQFYLQDILLTPPADASIPDQLRLNRVIFLLDTYAIRFLNRSADAPVDSWLQSEPSLLEQEKIINLEEKKGTTIFSEVNTAKICPIVTPTNASRVLIVTDKGGYDTFIRALSLANLNGQLLIPLRGPESIEALTPNDLQGVKALILYQFQGQNLKLIEDYVRKGGNVYVDIGALEAQNPSIPKILGVKELELFDRETDWQLTQMDSPLLEGIKINDFSPLKYGNDPWKIIAPPQSAYLEDWLNPVLLQRNRPILSSGKLGEGNFIFSGINLPFHITSYTNSEEVGLFTNIISSITQKPGPIGEFSLNRKKPSDYSLSYASASGIFIKENYDSGWQATINGRTVALKKASLNLMYLPIPEDLENGGFVELKYNGNKTSWILILISTAATITSIAVGLHAPPTEKMQSLINKYLTNPIHKWWEAEETE
jgi:hypothetical protein